MVAVDSAALKSLWYDKKNRTLRVTFRNERAYLYEGVMPHEYEALMAAGSKGAWFNHHIRDIHPVREI
jgi:KTSC domain-containing protein